jgi:hypothetical protein
MLRVLLPPKNSIGSPVRSARTVDPVQQLHLPSVDISGGLSDQDIFPRDHDLQEPVKLSFPRDDESGSVDG